MFKIVKFYVVSLLILLCVFVYGWCATPAYAQSLNSEAVPKEVSSLKLDPVDLSFLIPPGKHSIYLSSTGKNGPILSERLFSQFSDFREKGNPKIDNLYEKMIVTGFRFDPCGPFYPLNWDIKQCGAPNIRLIAQPYVDNHLATAALHMVFSLGNKLDQDPNPNINRALVVSGKNLDSSVRDEAITELKRMKAQNLEAGIDSRGLPIGIHPAFSETYAETSQVAVFAQKLSDFIHRYATEDSYFVTAVMFTVDPSSLDSPDELANKERWAWQQFGVFRFDPQTGNRLPAPSLAPVPLSGIAPSQLSQDYQGPTHQLTADYEQRSDIELLPKSISQHNNLKDGKPPRFQLNLPSANPDLEAILNAQEVDEWQDVAVVQKAMDVVDLLENPDKTLVNTEDCASCHLATSSRIYLEKYPKNLDLVALTHLYQFGTRFASNLTNALRSEDADWQSQDGVRIASFSFFKGRPSVAQRTANETIQAAYLINQHW